MFGECLGPLGALMGPFGRPRGRFGLLGTSPITLLIALGGPGDRFEGRPEGPKAPDPESPFFFWGGVPRPGLVKL